MDASPLVPASSLTRGGPRWLAKIESIPNLPVQAQANPWPDFLAGQAGKPVQVLLADEDAGVRRAITNELMMDPRVCVAGEAGSLQEAKRLLAQHTADVLIVDVRLGGGRGFELIEAARCDGVALEVIVHSTLDDDDTVRRAFALGACGYLVKNSWFQDFSQAVLQVVNGGAALSPGLARRLLRHAAHPLHEPPRPDAKHLRALSARECEVLRLVALGHVTREIAGQLSISAQTVCAHMKNICGKLQVRTRAHAVITATNRGFL